MRSLGLVAGGLAVLAAACTATSTATTIAVDTSASVSSLATTTTLGSPISASTVPLGDPLLVAVYEQDGLYTEGSFTHLELFRYFPDSDDFPVAVVDVDLEAPPSGTVLVEETLAPGVYELRSYQRPCVGSCDALEAPSDGCATRFSLEAGGTAEAVVTARPGLACRIDVTGASVEAPVLGMGLTLQAPGAPGCRPESPQQTNGITEVLATSAGDTVAWGLVWPPEGGRYKMVFRVTGDGDFNVVARHEDGTEIRSDWRVGEGATDSSSYGRPGLEWPMLFSIPTDGCWNIHMTRGDDTADVWLEFDA